MPDFNTLTPPANITNPKPVLSRDYPRHMHQYGRYLVIADADAQAAAEAEGWSLMPVHEDPDAPKAKKPAK